jgi:hypothetical protein
MSTDLLYLWTSRLIVEGRSSMVEEADAALKQFNESLRGAILQVV